MSGKDEYGFQEETHETSEQSTSNDDSIVGGKRSLSYWIKSILFSATITFILESLFGR